MYIGYTGAHSTRKTTSVYSRAAEEKLENPRKRVTIISETASDCPLPINEEATPESQLWIFSKQIELELQALHKYDIVVSDRTCVDSIAYSVVAGFSELAKAMFEIAKLQVPRYDHIVFKTISRNLEIYDNGFRSVDKGFRDKVEVALFNIYKQLGVVDRITME
jgi:hypothetical protein